MSADLDSVDDLIEKAREAQRSGDHHLDSSLQYLTTGTVLYLVEAICEALLEVATAIRTHGETKA